MTQDIDDQKELGFSLFQIMGEKDTLQVYIEDAVDYGLVSGNDVSNNWDYLLDKNLLFYDDTLDGLVTIDPSGCGGYTDWRIYRPVDIPTLLF